MERLQKAVTAPLFLGENSGRPKQPVVVLYAERWGRGKASLTGRDGGSVDGMGWDV